MWSNITVMLLLTVMIYCTTKQYMQLCNLCAPTFSHAPHTPYAVHKQSQREFIPAWSHITVSSPTNLDLESDVELDFTVRTYSTVLSGSAEFWLKKKERFQYCNNSHDPIRIFQLNLQLHGVQRIVFVLDLYTDRLPFLVICDLFIFRK